MEGFEYQPHLVAFIDILGFKELVNETDRNSAKLNEILKVLHYLKTWELPDAWGLELVEIEESAQYKGVENFNISEITEATIFSDSIVVSVKAERNINERFTSLVANLAALGAKMMEKGILIRGAITIGNLYHKSGVILGKGMIEAYQLELKSAVYPRIILSKKLIKELNYPSLAKRDRYGYNQYLQRYEDGCVGFHQMIYYVVIQSWVKMTPVILKDNLDKIRRVIIQGLDSNFENRDVFEKFKWLRGEYNNLCISNPTPTEEHYPLQVKDTIPSIKEINSLPNIYHEY